MLEAEAVTYKPHWLRNPFLLPAVVATIALYVVGTTILGLNWIICIVLLAQVILFFLLFKRPVWAMASLIVGQLTVSSFQFSLFGLEMSLRFFWGILALLILVPVLIKRGELELGNRASHVIIPVIIFFALATISNFVNTDFETAIRYLREPALVLVILLLLPATIKNDSDLKILCLVALITCTVSAIFALLQTYTPSAAYPAGFLEGETGGVRVTGLSYSPFYLGYMFPVVLLPIASIYFLKGVSPGTRNLLILLFIIIAMGLYFSYTRSGIYSLIPGFLLMAFFMKGKPKKQLIVISLIIFIVFFAFVVTVGNRYVQGFTSETSAAGRLVLWQAGLNVASDNPVLGLGVNQFLEVAPQYASTISASTLKNLGAGGILGVYNVHDDYITIWSSFGTIALLAYLWILASIFINFVIAYRHSQTRFLKGFTLGCIGAIGALLLYSAVNNLIESSMLIWVFGGLSIATTKMTLSR